MGIGIDIRVGYDQVRAAKLETELLTGSLRGAKEAGKFDIAPRGISEMLSEFTRIGASVHAATEEMRRFSSVRFDTSQFSEAVRQTQPFSRPELQKPVMATGLGERLEQGTGEQSVRYANRTATALALTQKQSAKLKADLKEVLADLKNIEKSSHDIDLKPSTRSIMMTEILSLEARKKELERDIKKVDTRVEVLQTRHNQQPQPERNAPAARTNDTEDHSRTLKKALGWTLAAAGGFTLLGFLNQSREKYKQSVGHTVTLGARGITEKNGDFNASTGIGIGALEQMALLENLSQQTGMFGAKAHGAAKMSGAFGKAMGVDPNQVTGVFGSTYRATGSEDLGGAVLGVMGKAVEMGMKRAKMPELLQGVQRNTGLTAAAMQGAGASTEQIMAMSTLAAKAMEMQKDGKSYGQFAKSDQMANLMTNGLKGAGSDAGEIMIWDLLGGFDKGAFTPKRSYEMEVMRQEGFASRPDLLMRGMESMGAKKNMTEEERMTLAGTMGQIAPSWGKGKSAKALADMFSDGTMERLKNAMVSSSKGKDGKPLTVEQLAKQGNADAVKYQKEYAALPGSEKMIRSALKESVELQAGAKLNDIFGKFESGALRLGDALLDGNWKKSFDILGSSTKDLSTVGKVMAGAAALYAAGGAMGMVGGAMSMGKGGVGMLGALSGPGGILAGLTLGGVAATQIFKNGAEGANYLPADRLNSLTGRTFTPTAFGGRLNPDVANNPRLSPGYKKYAVKIAEAAKRNGVPEPLLAGLIESESDFKNVPPRAVKLKNGKSISVAGFSQATEETAKHYKFDRMNPEQSIDGAARLLSDNFKKSGDWKQAVAQYKGVVTDSPENRAMVDGAFNKSGKYVRTEPERQVMQQATAGSDPALQIIAELLKTLTGYSEKTAINTGYRPPGAQPLAIR